MKWIVLGLLCGLGFGIPARAETPNSPVKPVRIALVGDSTMTDALGYGRGFAANLTADVTVLNEAKAGASTKTYGQEGWWTRALALRPDYMLIQFGHNDEASSEHRPRETDLQTEYPDNLKRFIKEARAQGIVPILVTPLTRRYYGADGAIHSDLLAHSEAVRRVAGDEKTPLIDLQADSIAYFNTLTPAEGNALGFMKHDQEGQLVPDKTHLNPQGSLMIGRIVAQDLAKAVPELAPYVKKEPATLSPEDHRTLAILQGGPVTIVLAGDSTVNEGGGWGPAFQALLTPSVTCINLARNGRSSKSYYDEGLWKTVLAQKPDYVLIQFGHNDMPGKGPARETDPGTTYSANLTRYVDEARAAGVRPVLVTSLSRRSYRAGRLVEDLAPYAAAARKVAEDLSVPLVDLNRDSVKLLQTMTQEQADGFDALAHPDAGGKGPDRTHLNPEGAKVFARMVADELSKACMELAADLQFPGGQP